MRNRNRIQATKPETMKARRKEANKGIRIGKMDE